MQEDDTALSGDFVIAETHHFQKKAGRFAAKGIYRKISTFVYPQLRANPFFGPNIKKLKGYFSELYRYRIGDYRMFYSVDTQRKIVFIADLEHRKSSYRRK